MRYSWLLPLVLVGGCSSNDTSVTIDDFVGIRLSGMCAVSPMTATLPSGILDVAAAQAVGQGYFAAPVVGNHIPERVNATGIEVDGVLLQRYNVRLSGDATTGPLLAGLPQFSVAHSTVRIIPGTEAATVVEVIPLSVATMLAGAVPGTGPFPVVVVSLQPVADHAGSVVLGPWAHIPVSLCSKCLFHDAGVCPLTSTIKSDSCLAQQDFSFACCRNPNGTLTCG